MNSFLIFLPMAALSTALTWVAESSPTSASMRGLDVVSENVIWASGTRGTWVKSTDGGRHWATGVVTGAEDLDFRDVEASDAENALLLSSGPGKLSRVYKTNDGGKTWRVLFTNDDEKGFFDALSFWNRQNGILLGDPVNGHFVIYTTGDGGSTWKRQATPPSLPNEGAFAASGTCLTIFGSSDVWFGTGGSGWGRVFHSHDRGQTWSVAQTPIPAKSPSAGIFSLVFNSEKEGWVTGGDYNVPNSGAGTFAITDDGGKTWRLARSNPSGYRSAIAQIKGTKSGLITVGSSGSDYLAQSGDKWRKIGSQGSPLSLNAVAAGPDGTVWAVGAHGAIRKLRLRLAH